MGRDSNPLPPQRRAYAVRTNLSISDSTNCYGQTIYYQIMCKKLRFKIVLLEKKLNNMPTPLVCKWYYFAGEGGN